MPLMTLYIYATCHMPGESRVFDDLTTTSPSTASRWSEQARQLGLTVRTSTIEVIHRDTYCCECGRHVPRSEACCWISGDHHHDRLVCCRCY